MEPLKLIYSIYGKRSATNISASFVNPYEYNSIENIENEHLKFKNQLNTAMKGDLFAKVTVNLNDKPLACDVNLNCNIPIVEACTVASSEINTMGICAQNQNASITNAAIHVSKSVDLSKTEISFVASCAASSFTASSAKEHILAEEPTTSNNFSGVSSNICSISTSSMISTQSAIILPPIISMKQLIRSSTRGSKKLTLIAPHSVSSSLPRETTVTHVSSMSMQLQPTNALQVQTTNSVNSHVNNQKSSVLVSLPSISLFSSVANSSSSEKHKVLQIGANITNDKGAIENVASYANAASTHISQCNSNTNCIMGNNSCSTATVCGANFAGNDVRTVWCNGTVTSNATNGPSCQGMLDNYTLPCSSYSVGNNQMLPCFSFYYGNQARFNNSAVSMPTGAPYSYFTFEQLLQPNNLVGPPQKRARMNTSCRFPTLVNNLQTNSVKLAQSPIKAIGSPNCKLQNIHANIAVAAVPHANG